MAARQIIRTCASVTTAGAPTFTVHLSTGAGVTFGALLWPSPAGPNGLAVLDPDRRGWRWPEAAELELLDATDMGRCWRERIERGPA